jgi:hypothetical protein
MRLGTSQPQHDDGTDHQEVPMRNDRGFQFTELAA